MNNLRVLVVAEDALARAGLAALLVEQPGCTVVGQADGGPELASAMAVSSADAIVWDLGWEPASALERLAGLPADTPPVVALAPTEPYAAEAWRAGARGLLLRDTPPASLIEALAAAAQGLAVLDPALAGSLAPAAERAAEPPSGELTPRERQVLQLLAEGLPNKAIAHRLSVSEHTAKYHVNAILGKLGAQSRTEAVIRATRLGWVLI